jgi:hypothetical protein
VRSFWVAASDWLVAALAMADTLMRVQSAGAAAS